MPTPPFTSGQLDRASRAFVAGALEGFDPRIGDDIEIPAPTGADTDARCASAMPSIGQIIRDRQMAALTRCLDLAKRAARLRCARAA